MQQPLTPAHQPQAKSLELPGRNVARRWLSTGELVMGRLKGVSEQDTLARAVENGDRRDVLIWVVFHNCCLLNLQTEVMTVHE